MKTLNEIPPTWSQKLLASERFELVLGDEGVLDKETGLVWERSPNDTTMSWSDAISHCYAKDVGDRKGWRLPTVAELASLVDPRESVPCLPLGNPFVNVKAYYYWSAANGDYTTRAWIVSMHHGYYMGQYSKKTGDFCAWCVRGGHGYVEVGR